MTFAAPKSLVFAWNLSVQGTPSFMYTHRHTYRKLCFESSKFTLQTVINNFTLGACSKWMQTSLWQMYWLYQPSYDPVTQRAMRWHIRAGLRSAFTWSPTDKLCITFIAASSWFVVPCSDCQFMFWVKLRSLLLFKVMVVNCQRTTVS